MQHLGDEVGKGITFRDKIKSWNPSTYDVSILDTLPDNHPVISAKTYSGKSFQYPLAVLEISIDMGGLKRLRLSQSEINNITKRLKIAPAERKRLVDVVQSSLIDFLGTYSTAITLGGRFNSSEFPNYFIDGKDIDLNNQRRFGTFSTSLKRDTEIIRIIKQQGLHRKSRHLQETGKMRIAVIDVIPKEVHTGNRNDQLTRFKKLLESLGIETIRATEPELYHTLRNPVDQYNELQSGIRKLIQQKPDIILVYLPDSDRERSSGNDRSMYDAAKRICIGQGIPSQIIYENTLSSNWADDNLILGILGKTGNVPYVLAQPLDYADVVVGLDVSRDKKTNAPGTMNFAALSRIYTDDGALIGYRASPAMAVEGETIPRSALENILPASEFGNKRVVIHRDGRFVGEELSNIMEWGDQIDAEFFPIEVTKSGTSRFYNERTNQILQASKSTGFLLNDKLAYVVSTPPPSSRKGSFSTSRPLQIANYSHLSFSNAIHSVLALTLLHYGSTRPTRLPVSTHASDKIAGFLRRNIHPNDMQGDIPFWL